MVEIDLKALAERFGDAVVGTVEFRGEKTLIVKPEALVEICRSLRDDPVLKFNFLSDIAAVDHLPREPRFEVSYHLLSIPEGHRLRVKVQLPSQDPRVPSVTSVWSGANWLEREVYDLMGIIFEGHPDLRRIMMPEDWEGHPHRRDYPVGKVKVNF